MTSAPSSDMGALSIWRITPRISIAHVIQAILGAVFLVASYAKAISSDDALLAVQSTIPLPSAMSEWLVGALIAFEAGLGASLILMRRSITPPALAAATLAAFSVWLVWADHALPSLSCGCFGATGLFAHDLSLSESLVRNGLLIFAAIALIVQRIVQNVHTH